MSKNPLPKKAWALVCYGDDGHLLEFANGFGIFPTQSQADECARDYKGAYLVVRIAISHVIHQGDQCPACAIGHARRSQNGLRCANCGWSEPISTQVMNPPADQAEARNLAKRAPLQSDPDDQRRGKTGMSSGSEARPVTATALLPNSQE